jgi:hypothetical protein
MSNAHELRWAAAPTEMTVLVEADTDAIGNAERHLGKIGFDATSDIPRIMAAGGKDPNRLAELVAETLAGHARILAEQLGFDPSRAKTTGLECKGRVFATDAYIERAAAAPTTH